MPLINDLVELGQGQMPQLEDYDPALAERTEIQHFNILQLSIVRGHFFRVNTHMCIYMYIYIYDSHVHLVCRSFFGSS